MREEIKKEFIEHFKKTKREEFVLGDSSLNVWVENKYIFPYNRLDDVRKALDTDIRKYTIYFVLSKVRREILGYEKKGGVIELEYCEMRQGRKILQVSLYELLGGNREFYIAMLPLCEFEIRNCKTAFRLTVPSKNMKFLKEVYPYIYKELPEAIRKEGYFYLEYDIDNLIWTMGKKSLIDKFNLLYIGKSNSENEKFDILDRVSSHKTIQKISRDNNLDYRSQDLFVMLISFRSKHYKQYGLNKDKYKIIFGNSEWEKLKLLMDISENQETILLIEAMLINHFKPKYNTQYVEELKQNYKIVQIFLEQEVNPVSLELDLSMPWGKIQMSTKFQSTKNKMRNIECYMQDGQIDTEGYDMSDKLYDLL